MASEGAIDISAEHRKSSAEQPDASLADEWDVVSTEARSKQDMGSDEENAFEDCHTPFRDSRNKASIRVPRMFHSHV
jgi:hypothetical protein